MGSRLELHTMLTEVMIDILGFKNVYFQPPESFQLEYPCIIYSRDSELVNHANNHLYSHKKRYQITVVDQDPDSLIPDAVRNLKFCVYNRHYVSDNLHHDVYTIYI